MGACRSTSLQALTRYHEYTFRIPPFKLACLPVNSQITILQLDNSMISPLHVPPHKVALLPLSFMRTVFAYRYRNLIALFTCGTRLQSFF